jgi:hypothetical protein
MALNTATIGSSTMTMLTHARSPYLPQRQDTIARVSIGTPHLEMIWRFFKFTMGMLLCMAIVAGVIAVKVVAWFPHFHN